MLVPGWNLDPEFGQLPKPVVDALEDALAGQLPSRHDPASAAASARIAAAYNPEAVLSLNALMAVSAAIQRTPKERTPRLLVLYAMCI